MNIKSLIKSEIIMVLLFFVCLGLVYKLNDIYKKTSLVTIALSSAEREAASLKRQLRFHLYQQLKSETASIDNLLELNRFMEERNKWYRKKCVWVRRVINEPISKKECRELAELDATERSK